MTYSNLSIRKVNNIERQIELYKHKTVEIIEAENAAKYLVFNSGERSLKLRDFYEYYIDDQPLINILSKYYWNIEANENSKFFNTHVGCLGGFGLFWDEISISILTNKDFNSAQVRSLVNIFRSNLIDSANYTSIQSRVIKHVRENFLMYCCQDCGDSGCGGISLNIEKGNNTTIWTDNDKIEIHFNTTKYNQVLQQFISKRRLELN